MCEICSKLTIQTTEQSQWHRCGVFLLTLTDFTHCFDIFIDEIKKVNAGCVHTWPVQNVSFITSHMSQPVR